MHKVIAEVEYVMGHLRTGHYELRLTDEELVAFQAQSKEEQEEQLRDEGEFIVDDSEVDDIGPIESIRIKS